MSAARSLPENEGQILAQWLRYYEATREVPSPREESGTGPPPEDAVRRLYERFQLEPEFETHVILVKVLVHQHELGKRFILEMVHQQAIDLD